MNLEQIVDEYKKRKDALRIVQKGVDELKELIAKQIDKQGHTDDKGHKRLQAGKWALKRQWNQGEPVFDRDEAEEWARELGIFEDVSYQPPPEIDEDKLARWVFEHRNEPGLEERYHKLWKEKKGHWSFIEPQEVNAEYDEY